MLKFCFVSASPSQTFPFPRNEDVVVREEVFSQLSQLLPPILEYQTAVLWGLGGSGYKSRLE